MREILALPSFERSVKKLSSPEKKSLVKSLEKFNRLVRTGEVPTGLGFRKINHDKYEFRIDIRLRVVVKEEGDIFYLVLVGSHDEIRRYLREHR